VTLDARFLLYGVDLIDHLVERSGHPLVHRGRLVALDKVRRPTTTAQKLRQLLGLDAGQQGRIGDLETIQVQNGQHRAVGLRVEEFVGMLGCCERPGLGLAVAHDAGNQELRVVERRAKSMAERIAQLTALVNRARAFR
jgi:hypothetical protein